ncbi:MAG: dTDP-glucose 4,6-dehydratase [Corynebacterium glucuronolyticum]|nr:dTDP-glucose 4,6-dehydratase [Corynebacterium glucuronolyticum]MDD7585636.1 dTDP-glucose 4,6-dehydratase [Mycobacteriaceae bacterium]MDY5835384.1 dTDP-glucose 4,6-dehydratase [Corynebacterium glucuronolyticum]
MNILVTGGAGFIGSNFCHYTLAHYDHEITVLDALTYAGNPASVPEGCRLVHGSILDEELVDDLVKQSDVVVHFAAESHNDNSLRDPLAFVRTNVEGTTVLAAACVRHDIRLHHISTDEVYGDLPLTGGEPFTPETPYRPSSPYSASKASADHIVRAFVRSFGLRATISNCSNNYGPRQHPEKFIPRQILALENGEPVRLYGDGLNVRDWIHVDDHNSAVWAILERGEIGGTYLIGAHGELSNRDVVEELIKHYPGAEVIHVQDRPGHDRRYAIDPSSVEALGWEPRYTSFPEGLAQTIDWYRANKPWWEDARERSEKIYRATEQARG